jgi:hypothetical protein
MLPAAASEGKPAVGVSRGNFRVPERIVCAVDVTFGNTPKYPTTGHLSDYLLKTQVRVGSIGTVPRPHASSRYADL